MAASSDLSPIDGAAGTGPPSIDMGHAFDMPIAIDSSMEGIDWERAKSDLAADDFDNGRSADALDRSFRRSQHVAFARHADRLVGMARLLSDGVANAYLLDVWTASPYRRRGIGSQMVKFLAALVPGQHIGLQTEHAQSFYARLGFRHQPAFMSLVVGEWLDNPENG